MKYHSILTPALTALCLLTSHNTLATDNTTVSAVKEERWFEIEVILFKQVSNNSEMSEQFSSSDLSAKKRRAFDLLAPYLQPDIASLKQLLPNCEQPEAKLPYNISANTLWAEKVAIESNDADRSDTETVSLLSENERVQDVTQAQVDDNKAAISSTNMSVTVLSAAPNEAIDEGVDTAAEQGLIAARYQVKYATIELPVYNQYPISSQIPLCVIPADFFQQHLNSEQLEQFSIDGFPVEKLAKTINGLEQWQDDESGEITWASDSPYLISQDSLRLKSIANRIKRSRNYAPLLHLGWRQIGESRRQAKAMKLYAGEHLYLRYQQAIATQESERQTLEIQAILEQRQQAEVLMHSNMSLVGGETAQVTATATSAIMSDNATDNATNKGSKIISQRVSSDLAVEHTEAISELSIAEQLRLQAKRQQLDKLFQQFALLGIQTENQTDTQEMSNATTSVNNANEAIQNEELIQGIIAQLSADITAKEVQLKVNNATGKQVAITAPLQPWSIDGLFKVHLDHYLYITTELNILDSSHKPSTLSAKQKSTNKDNKTASQNKVISFKQDRRVISGEIHYFDHPHIGMIVQIRRFDPRKSAEEAVSQSKK